ncbi:hypothetical protein A7Q01_02505 [Eikenella sp. NML96-A-049]|uniref:XRE family transcriptional regulator n=1 Tax=Eikenella exigua TaxID=2528037 RepID=A0AAX1F893_9NEIS|nr:MULTISPECIES: helix-turn-helix transcriptional regulator [Eikenella]OAM40501.1 hypothetical protein A7Q01_02505 [Eikenella sp. NML96-A-049]VDH01255.1 Uncharacterised protein [Helicobacter pametensis]OAM28484.1 hypothetical protein A7P94_00100 [Eikenella sp. NML01-A-086]OAM31644.1 hypothetical protein A7P96_05000 [Eikenella sp. NML03-A-027]OAM35128.1 hypothetical protein A7P97_00240 [Eikenella sp. NML070372]
MKPRTLVANIKKKGLSNEAIAKNIGCSTAYVSKLNNGTRTTPSYIVMDKLRALYAEVFRVKP